MSDIAIRVEDLSKQFRIGAPERLPHAAGHLNGYPDSTSSLPTQWQVPQDRGGNDLGLEGCFL